MKRFVGLVAALVVAGGCTSDSGPVLPVNGIVTLDGKPLDGATVTFYPESPGGTVGTAETGSDGKFILVGVGGQQGLPPGKYKATVSKVKLPGGGKAYDDPTAGAVTDTELRSDLPAIYSNPERTILSYSVTGDGKPTEIELSSRGR
jgi:hypothetical protein